MSGEGQRWWRLAGMMALIYAIQGAWWPVLAVHLQDLGIDGRARGWIFATFAIASTITPLNFGQLADRSFPAQRLLGACHGVGALLLGLIAFGVATSAPTLFLLFLVYWLIAAPGYGLSNALALRNLPRPTEQFGGVRMWGTVGWMFVGYIVTAAALVLGAGKGSYGSVALGVGAAVSLVFSIYAFTALPHTPPLATGGSRAAQLREGLELVRRPEVATFLLLALVVSLTTPFVYQAVPAYLHRAGLARGWIAPAMTLAQVPEIAGLALLPWMHRRLGLRGSLLLGLAAWVVEYLTLACEPGLPLALLVIPFNGLAIAGFVVSGQMYLDTQAPAARRAGVQALWVVLISGIGPTLGSILAGEITSWNGGVGTPVFLIPGLLNVLAMIVLATLFRPGAFTIVAPRASAPAAARLATARLDFRHGSD